MVSEMELATLDCVFCSRDPVIGAASVGAVVGGEVEHEVLRALLEHLGTTTEEEPTARREEQPSRSEDRQPEAEPESAQTQTEPVQPESKPDQEKVQPESKPDQEKVQPESKPAQEKVQPESKPAQEKVQQESKPAQEKVQSDSSLNILSVECQICLRPWGSLVRRAVVLPCMHGLGCLDCLQRVLTTAAAGQAQCPFCREPFSEPPEPISL
ncbi:translation initiation factor IF-2-like [Amphibalanus amphitrite]|uniref:translation initiation factor IF-2-like n=1 Tax=Amphibalanus amphitrite TaxID=1232801 RepID=UPI001C91EB2B|nr:translation initiation factor IF-2-like [Amphibalanus amphitrite]